MSGPSVGGTSERWLQPGVAIRKLYEKVEPNLIISNFIAGPIAEDRASFMYLEDSTGISGDTKKQTAPRFEVGGDLPRLDFSVPTVSGALMESKGFEISVPRAVVRDGVAGAAAIERYFTRAGYTLAQQMEADQIATMEADAGASTASAPTAEWSEPDATPVTDLMNAGMDMDTVAGPYRQTDALVNKDAFYELKEYLNFLDGTQFNDGRPTGEMVNNDTIYVKQADCMVHKVLTGVTAGSIISLDRNIKGTELHTYSDPLFSLGAKSVRYPTVVDGKQVMKEAPNYGLHYYEYMEKDTKNTIMQFWFENKTVVTESLALRYDTGI